MKRTVLGLLFSLAIGVVAYAEVGIINDPDGYTNARVERHGGKRDIRWVNKQNLTKRTTNSH